MLCKTVPVWKFLNKLKLELPQYPAIPHIFEENKNTNLERYMHLNVHSSFIYNRQDMEATQVSINRGMDKEDMIHTHTHTHTHMNITQP